MYGYQIAKQLDETGEGVLSGKQSALYPVLRNLESTGLLASEVEPSVQGPPRRYYRITPAGRRVLAEWSLRLDGHPRFRQYRAGGHHEPPAAAHHRRIPRSTAHRASRRRSRADPGCAVRRRGSSALGDWPRIPASPKPKSSRRSRRATARRKKSPASIVDKEHQVQQALRAPPQPRAQDRARAVLRRRRRSARVRVAVLHDAVARDRHLLFRLGRRRALDLDRHCRS